jgi:hypothetical protein
MDYFKVYVGSLLIVAMSVGAVASLDKVDLASDNYKIAAKNLKTPNS